VTPAQEKILRWRNDPVFFVVDELKGQPDDWQVDFLRAFQSNNRLALKACKGPGKTAALSWAAWNFLATRPHPKIAATSITSDNLSDGLWAEMAKWRNNSKFLKESFEWNKTRIFAKAHSETWFMSARTWPKSGDNTQQANTLAGIHADYVLFILDESGGIPDSVMAAAEAALATGIETKIVQAGNPTHLEGPLYRACTNERHLWWLSEITADPDDPKRSKRVSLSWAKEQIEKYGRDNPWVLVNVFGQFPPSSINSLLGPDEVSEAMRRTYSKDIYEWSQKRLGIDVARFGDDRTVIFPRQGLVAFRPAIMRHDPTKDKPSVDIANRVMEAKLRWNQEQEFFDGGGGWAKGALDILRAAGHSPIDVQGHLKAYDPRYKNMRCQCWWDMAQWVKNGGALPMMPELVRELTALTYTFVNGAFVLEEKAQVKERIGVSPDLGDGLALTFAMPEAPMDMARTIPGIRSESNKVLSDYDPFDSNRS
jgi:phage terminase large subunit